MHKQTPRPGNLDRQAAVRFRTQSAHLRSLVADMPPSNKRGLYLGIAIRNDLMATQADACATKATK